MTTWVQLGSSSISLGPAAEPAGGHHHGRHGPERGGQRGQQAAPVGVVSSTRVARP